MTMDSIESSYTAFSLPQYGFGTEVDFDKLITDNHFLFRVYTPKAPSPFADDTEPFFVAPKFNERYTRSPDKIAQSPCVHDDSYLHAGSYEDVVAHMDWSTKSSSPYVSTSFSFVWAIWEALRRYHLGVKKDVEIAVIDAHAVAKRAATTVQLLEKASSSRRRAEHWKWHRNAQESQSVLIYEYVSASAVLASIPLPSLLAKLPSYFLRHDLAESSEHHRLASLGWDYTEKKRNYRRFCQEISNRFLQSCEETKLEDTTTGSVRLAMAFIRPWLHSRVHDDLHTATSKLCALAFNIALWPGRWWAQEHSELWNLIHGMSLSLIEEIHGANDPQHALEVTRLKGVVVELEDAVQRYKKDLESRNSRKPTRFLSPLVIPIPPRGQAPPVVNEPHLTIRHPASQPTPVQVVVPMKTPITPPTSPIRTGFQNTFLHLSPPSTTDHSFSVNTESRHLSPCSEPLTVSEPTTEPSAQDAIPPSPESLCSEISFSIQPSSSLETQRSPLSPTLLQLEEIMITSDSSLEDSEDSCDSFVHNHDDVVLRLPGQRIRLRRAATIMETASCVVTGFFIGAFITLCILSPQRRTLLTHLT